MLKVNIDEENLVLILEPEDSLSESDFQSVAKVVDPLIEKYGQLNGIVIHTKSFPGWDSFAAFSSHLSFVKNHHQKIARIAIVTDSLMGDFAEKIASHFVNAKIKSFSYQEFEKAKSWVNKNIG